MLDVETLYRECSDDLYRALRRRFDRSVPDQLIEDACQATWTIAWTHRNKVEGESPFAWLVTVALHEAFALLRKGRRERSSTEAAERLDERSDLELALAAREALALQAAGYSYAELAAIAGKSLTWANRHITEGRARLRLLAAD